MNLTLKLTRAKFEELNMDLFKSTVNPVKKVLEDGDLRKEDVDEVVPLNIDRFKKTWKDQANESEKFARST